MFPYFVLCTCCLTENWFSIHGYFSPHHRIWRSTIARYQLIIVILYCVVLFGLSSSCVLCTQCYQFLCMDCPLLIALRFSLTFIYKSWCEHSEIPGNDFTSFLMSFVFSLNIIKMTNKYHYISLLSMLLVHDG